MYSSIQENDGVRSKSEVKNKITSRREGASKPTPHSQAVSRSDVLSLGTLLNPMHTNLVPTEPSAPSSIVLHRLAVDVEILASDRCRNGWRVFLVHIRLIYWKQGAKPNNQDTSPRLPHIPSVGRGLMRCEFWLSSVHSQHDLAAVVSALAFRR